MTDALRKRIMDDVLDSVDSYGYVEPNAEALGGGLIAVLDFADELVAPSAINPTTRPYARAIRDELRQRITTGMDNPRG